MDPVTLLLGGVLIVVTLLFLFSSNGNKARLASEVSRIPGPPAYPIVGSVLPVLFLKRNGEQDMPDPQYLWGPQPVPIGLFFNPWNGGQMFLRNVM
jgi:hypothetical protein